MDKTFDETIAGIRTAERGVEVREDIAQGMEYVKQYAEEVTGQQPPVQPKPQRERPLRLQRVKARPMQAHLHPRPAKPTLKPLKKILRTICRPPKSILSRCELSPLVHRAGTPRRKL